MTAPPIGLHVGQYLRWQRLLRDHVPRLFCGYGPCRRGLLFAREQPTLGACIKAMRVRGDGGWIRWWAAECWFARDRPRGEPHPTTAAERIAEIHAWADRCCPIPEAT